MAFRDENGRITIDEAAAQQDIANLAAAIEQLQSVAARLDQIAAQAAEFSGKTGEGIAEAAVHFSAETKNIMECARETAESIRTTVQKYQAIDQSLKNTIINS